MFETVWVYVVVLFEVLGFLRFVLCVFEVFEVLRSSVFVCVCVLILVCGF